MRSRASDAGRERAFAVVWQANTYQFDVEDLDGNILVFWGDKL